jgi:hypothetical protein
MRALNALVDLVARGVGGVSPLAAVSVVAVLVGALVLAALRWMTDPPRIRATKRAITARILELWLFRGEPRIVLSAQWRILGLNARYLALLLAPTAVAAVPVTLLLVSVDGVFAWRPLRPGEAAVVTVRASTPTLLRELRLEGGDGVAVETPPLRDPGAGEVAWRIRPRRPGIHTIAAEARGRRWEKTVVVADGLVRVGPVRLDSGLWQAVRAPEEPPLEPASGLARFEVRYPARALEVLGMDTHWIVPCLAVSFGVVLALRRAAGVEL